MDAFGACGWSAWIRLRCAAIGFVVIEAPFPNVPSHVLNAEWTGAEREGTHRRSFRVTAVDFAIAPGKHRISVRKVREIPAAIVIAPWVLAAVVSFGGIFPFR